MLGFGPIGSRPLADDGDSGAVTSVALDAGAYTLAGAALSIAISATFSLDAGAYSLTGQDLTVSRSYAVALDAGSFDLTGSDLTIGLITAVALDAGAYALTSSDLSVVQSLGFSLDAGAYTLTGNDVPLSISTGNINLDAGEYTLSGWGLSVAVTDVSAVAEKTNLTVPLFGSPFTENGALNAESAETLERMVLAIEELQSSPIFEDGDGPILLSPNGTQYRLTVDDAGNLSTVAI